MSLRDRLRPDFRPWHGLMAAVFVVGAASSVARNDLLAAEIGPETLFLPVIEGLLGVVVFQFTVGNVWGYAVEYYNAGGQWSDPVFLAPFVVTAAAGVAAFVVVGDAVTAAAVAFWTFVLAAAVLAVTVQVAVGYRAAGRGTTGE